MNKILLIEPYTFLSSRYENNEGYLIYHDKTLISKNKQGCLSESILYPSSALNEVDIDKIKLRIDWTLPLWLRWMGEADSYEDFQRTCLLFVIALIEKLREHEVQLTVFFTGVAHHVEYALIEAACQLAEVKQLFLYPVPFSLTSMRLLPMIQFSSIMDRQPSTSFISDQTLKVDILDYRKNYLALKPPKLNEKVDFKATSFVYAYIKAYQFELKKIVKSILQSEHKQKMHPIDQQKTYGFSSLLRIIKRQKASVEYYISRMSSDDEIDRLLDKSHSLPIIYAHYQPEASTFPEGGRYPSHLDLVIQIRRLGYEGPILYKEHPGSRIYYSQIVGFSLVGLCRSIEYYKQLEALGCIFTTTEYKLNETRSGRLFPITITGSVAVERSLTGHATCCAGVPWFLGAPGIFNLEQSFCKNGVFYDHTRWRIAPEESLAWFDKVLAHTTLINYPGIGTGLVLSSEQEKNAFLTEFDQLMQTVIT